MGNKKKTKKTVMCYQSPGSSYRYYKLVDSAKAPKKLMKYDPKLRQRLEFQCCNVKTKSLPKQ
jgi:hypothetical protein